MTLHVYCSFFLSHPLFISLLISPQSVLGSNSQSCFCGQDKRVGRGGEENKEGGWREREIFKNKKRESRRQHEMKETANRLWNRTCSGIVLPLLPTSFFFPKHDVFIIAVDSFAGLLQLHSWFVCLPLLVHFLNLIGWKTSGELSKGLRGCQSHIALRVRSRVRGIT